MAVLVDSNVLLDVASEDPRWVEWSSLQIQVASRADRLVINPIIYAEIAPAFSTAESLDRWLDTGVFDRLPLPYNAGWLASKAFVQYRRSGGSRPTPLPDFYIGAHAVVESHRLLTRDPARYRTYFPSIELIAPAE